MKAAAKKVAQINEAGWAIESLNNGNQALRKNFADGTFVRVQLIEKTWVITRHHADGSAQCGHHLPSWKQMLAYLNEVE